MTMWCKKMKKTLRFSILILIIVSCLTLCGCFDKKTTTEDKVYVSLSQTTYNMLVGDMKKITYEVLIDDGSSALFTSSDTSIATVTKSGYVKAVKIGSCTINLDYGEHTYAITINVTKEASFVAPTKTVYYVDETIDLTGGVIHTYLPNGSINEYISVTNEMISGFDTSSVGEYTVTISYEDYEFSYYINVIKRPEDNVYDFNTLTFPSFTTGNNSVIKATAVNMKKLDEAVSSFYDYSSFELTLEVTAPSGAVDLLYAYYTIDYKEVKTTLSSMDSSLRTEGTVNSKTGFNYSIAYVAQGDHYFAFKYEPTEEGEYTYVFKVLLQEEVVVDTESGTFSVDEGKETKGTIKVSENNVSFVYENGDTYIPVGANVSWYTSTQRKFDDFALWFDSMEENGLNFARIWLAAWGGSLFWDDVENYDTRLDDAYGMDKVFELALEAGIEIDLTIFHHGMFTIDTNSMWNASSNAWYVSRYGYNPYSDKISSPSAFFTGSYGVKWCKNYIKYIVARYGTYDNLMSYELFNEVDWVEGYNATDGTTWHDTMANYIKSLDYKYHMVTSSTTNNGSSGYTDGANTIYNKLFSLNSIDYVSLHHYGGNNYFSFVPSNGNKALNAFNKPVMFQELGYSGNGGQDQMNVDPNDTSLHASIWAGMMTTASTGMPWWWESWLEVSNSWTEYKGASKFIEGMDLEGDMTLLFSGGITSTSNKVRKMGYLFNDRAYIYLCHTSLNVGSTNNGSLTTSLTLSIDEGTYTVELYNTYTGEIISKQQVTTSKSNTINFSVTFTDDVAIKIYK